MKRRYVLAFFQKLQPCLVGIEACASSHYWSRELQALGHTVRLMPPAYVKPYVKRQKNMRPTQRQSARRSQEPTCGLCHQDARATKLADAPSHTPSVHPAADGGHQCDPSQHAQHTSWPQRFPSSAYPTICSPRVLCVASHPAGSNITGVSILGAQTDGKRLEILMEAVPSARNIAILADPNNTPPEELKALQYAARARGVVVAVFTAGTPEQIAPGLQVNGVSRRQRTWGKRRGARRPVVAAVLV